MINREILKEASLILNIPLEVVEKTYNGFWKAIHSHISSLHFTLEEKVNVNIPLVGKLYYTTKSYKHGNKHKED